MGRPASSDVTMVSRFTGARRKISSPSASESALEHCTASAPDRRLADAPGSHGRFRIGNIEGRLFHVTGTSRIVGGLF